MWLKVLIPVLFLIHVLAQPPLPPHAAEGLRSAVALQLLIQVLLCIHVLVQPPPQQKGCGLLWRCNC